MDVARNVRGERARSRGRPGALVLTLHTVRRVLVRPSSSSSAVIPPAGQTRAFLLLCLGFAVAAGLVPRGRGLPGMKAAARACLADLRARDAARCGVSFIRISLPVLPDASRAFGPAMMTLAIAASLAAAVLSLARGGWQRLAACACIGQMGVAIAGAFALTPDGITGSMVPQIATGLGARGPLPDRWSCAGRRHARCGDASRRRIVDRKRPRVRHLRRSAAHRRRRVAGQRSLAVVTIAALVVLAAAVVAAYRSDAPRP